MCVPGTYLVRTVHSYYYRLDLVEVYLDSPKCREQYLYQKSFTFLATRTQIMAETNRNWSTEVRIYVDRLVRFSNFVDKYWLVPVKLSFLFFLQYHSTTTVALA